MTQVGPNFIRESNLIEGIDSKTEDLRSWNAWKWLREQETITQPVLLELHKRITKGQLSERESGHYRQVQVYVGAHTPPAPMIAQGQIYGLLIDLMEHWETLDPREVHIRFEKIHPFVDGNGRAGRMLWWWHEIKKGQEPTFIRSNETDRHYYYQMFREAE